MRELALRNRMPMVWLIDSAGARIDPRPGRAPTDLAVRRHRPPVPRAGGDERRGARRSRRWSARARPAPPTSPGSPTSCRWSRARARWRSAARRWSRRRSARTSREEELGGSQVHCEMSGVGDVEVESDEACIEAIKDYLSFMPQHCERAAADRARAPTRSIAPTTRCSTCVPENHAQDLRHVRGDPPRSSTTASTSTSSRGGRGRSSPASRGSAAGRSASSRNNPKQLGGILDVDTADKAARFIQTLRRVQHPARVPDGRAGLHGRHQGRARRASSATARRCCTRWRRRRCRSSPW